MGKFKDLSGKRFERLLVVKREEGKFNQAYWLCCCDCGNQIIVASQKLISGSTKSCGCLRNENNKKRNELRKSNLAGMTFGEFTVLRRDMSEERNSWVCECSCGEIRTVQANELIKGKVKSCGCQKTIRNKKRTVPCEYEVENSIVKVTLRTGEYMVCDLEDWNYLKFYGWRLGSTGYAQTRVDGKNLKFHVEVMGRKTGFVIDHINRNRLDNRKENLRFVTQEVNTLNRSMQRNNKCGHKGIYYDKSRDKYVAEIKVKGKKIYLGRYENIEDAINAREKAVEEYHVPIINEN